MKNIYVFMSCLWFIGCFQKGKEEVLIPGMQNLYLLSDAKSRSISPENPSGEADRRGMTELEEGNAGKAASELGKGWKVNPYIFIQPGETTVLAEAQGPGIINHIRITPAGERSDRLRISVDEIIVNDVRIGSLYLSDNYHIDL